MDVLGFAGSYCSIALLFQCRAVALLLLCRWGGARHHPFIATSHPLLMSCTAELMLAAGVCNCCCSIIETYGKKVEPKELEEVLRLEYRSAHCTGCT